jgi:hypothetical protein
MLGSDHAGERDNALSFIRALAAKYRMTLNEIMVKAYEKEVRVEVKVQAPPPPPPPPSSPSSWKPVRMSNGADCALLDALDRIAENHTAFDFVLTKWETDFAGDVARRYVYDSELSEKQRAIVERIIEKIRRANAR